MRTTLFWFFAAVVFISFPLAAAEDNTKPAEPPVPEKQQPAKDPAAAEVPVPVPAEPEKPKEPVRKQIRHGQIYSAEISFIKPEIQAESKEEQPGFENPVWAAIILKMPQNRAVSRFDYELETQPGKCCPCIAAAYDKEPFSFRNDQWIQKPVPEKNGRFVRLLFAIPQSDLTAEQPMQEFPLIYTLDVSKIPPAGISFRLLPKDQPLNMDPAQLGDKGNYGLSWLDLHPPVPAPEAKPAEPASAPAADAAAKPAGSPAK